MNKTIIKRALTCMGLLSFFLLGTKAVAQESNHINLRMESRGDYQYENIDGNPMDAANGFRGKQLNLRLNGTINDSWSYVYRQRMGKPNADASYFDAVDHINLTYTTGAWAFTGGKQTVAVGGYEYDRAPIDFYFGSEYWYNMACYQWGVNAKYNFGNESNDALTLQVVQSPFRTALNPDMYSYNLMWTCSYGWVDYLHSVNLLEYQPGKYVGFLALGYQFHMGDLPSSSTLWIAMIRKVRVLMTSLSWQTSHGAHLISSMSSVSTLTILMMATMLTTAYFPVQNSIV